MNFRKKSKRNIQEIEELDITSLLDILVILLVFLLQNFNSSELSIGIVEEIVLPYSKSSNIVRAGPVLQTNKKEDVYLNGRLLTNIKDKANSQLIIDALKEINPDMENAKKINLLFDKTIKYSTINNILRIADDAGYTKYKLIVQGHE